jgi:hypothetical protein
LGNKLIWPKPPGSSCLPAVQDGPRFSHILLPGYRYQDHPFLCRFLTDHHLVLRGVCPGPQLAPGWRHPFFPVPPHHLPLTLVAPRRRRHHHRHFPDQVFHHPHLFLRLGLIPGCMPSNISPGEDPRLRLRRGRPPSEVLSCFNYSTRKSPF